MTTFFQTKSKKLYNLACIKESNRSTNRNVFVISDTWGGSVSRTSDW